MSGTEGTGYLLSRRTLNPVQAGETIFTRTSVLGRLVAFAAVGGVLAAAMVIPVVTATGVLVRNQADKFTTLSLNAQGLPQRSEILDRNGHFLAYLYSVDVPYYNSADSAGALEYFGWDRQPVSYSQITPDMVNAVVAIEDSRYWLHGAIDLRGTIRAAVNDIQHKPVQGGSTIAQQYVKNVLLLEAELANNSQAVQAAAADTLNRKLNELRMAVAAEHQQSKQDILAGYLNDAYFGHNAYGIETAAETYFGTNAAHAVGNPGRHPGRHRGEPDGLRPDPALRDGPPAAQYRAGPDGPDRQRDNRGAGHCRRGQAARPARF